MQNIVVDANNMLYRAVFNSDSHHKKRGIPHKMVDGMNVSYVQSFLWFLYHSTEKFQNIDTTIYLVWDKKLDPNAKNWRNDIIPSYKMQRDQESETRQSVHDTTNDIKRITDAMGIVTIYPLSSEGDDIMNHLVNTLEGDSVIVSADQDFYQCVSENVSVYSPMKDITITHKNFREHVDVDIEHFVRWKSIKGDSSDNIKGLYRYGDVKAKKLVEDWDNLSEKLSSEDHQIIKECVEVIDLNSRPLSDKELYAVEFQLNKLNQRCSDRDLKTIFDYYDLDVNTRKGWYQYFDLMDMANIYD